jgi:hypothetical protein
MGMGLLAVMEMGTDAVLEEVDEQEAAHGPKGHAFTPLFDALREDPHEGDGQQVARGHAGHVAHQAGLALEETHHQPPSEEGGQGRDGREQIEVVEG